eukprot:SAG11_NODE_3575_length_2359_cov_3.684071_1_plen_126_part_00
MEPAHDLHRLGVGSSLIDKVVLTTSILTSSDDASGTGSTDSTNNTVSKISSLITDVFDFFVDLLSQNVYKALIIGVDSNQIMISSAAFASASDVRLHLSDETHMMSCVCSELQIWTAPTPSIVAP